MGLGMIAKKYLVVIACCGAIIGCQSVNVNRKISDKGAGTIWAWTEIDRDESALNWPKSDLVDFDTLTFAHGDRVYAEQVNLNTGKLFFVYPTEGEKVVLDDGVWLRVVSGNKFLEDLKIEPKTEQRYSNVTTLRAILNSRKGETNACIIGIKPIDHIQRNAYNGLIQSYWCPEHNSPDEKDQIWFAHELNKITIRTGYIK